MIEGRKVDRTSALDISLSISPRFYFHRIDRGMGRERERETRQKTGVTVPANSVGTAVLAKKWKLHRDDFHVAVEATISRAARVRQEC